MKLTSIQIDIERHPAEMRPLLSDASVFDSSCTPEAKVLFIDRDCGYFLKSAAKGSLRREADMTRYFHQKGLSANVLNYVSDDCDWLLTEKIPGDDCVAQQYLSQPERLCDTLAQRLRLLHSTDFTDCPIPNHTQLYLEKATQNYGAGRYDKDLFPDNWGYQSAGEAWAVIQQYGDSLKTDTLLHGDYCLPNILLHDWQFSGLIDLDNAGVGDRHVDLFWGAWTLFFNLKTDQYRERFFDAYGRDEVDEDMLRLVAAAEVFG